jgi:hypothetical protein
MLKLFQLFYVEQRDRPTRRLLSWSHAQLLKDNRFGNGVHAIILLGTTIFLFSSVKTAIPSIQPFLWDELFMRLDRALFLGLDPWAAFQSVLGFPYITALFSVFYNMWIIVIAVVISFVLFAGSSSLRTQFLMSCVLSWVIAGNVLAILFSSAGPCYYGFLVDGENPYLAQMEYLRHADEVTGMLFSLQVQDILWSAYVSNEGRISGISAMPSLHIMFALLIAFYVMKRNKALGYALLVYAGIIFIGSIHLAWHYAVDGIVALVLALAAWRVSGWIAKWAEARQLRTGDAAV